MLLSSSTTFHIIFEMGSKPRDPPVSAYTELGLQSHAIFHVSSGESNSDPYVCNSKHFIELLPKLISCNFCLKTLSQQPSVFCPSSLLLHICYRNVKKDTSGTAEPHLKITEEN